MKAWPIAHGSIGRRLGDDFAAVFQGTSTPAAAGVPGSGAGETLWVVDSLGVVEAVSSRAPPMPDPACASRGIEDS